MPSFFSTESHKGNYRECYSARFWNWITFFKRSPIHLPLFEATIETRSSARWVSVNNVMPRIGIEEVRTISYFVNWHASTFCFEISAHLSQWDSLVSNFHVEISHENLRDVRFSFPNHSPASVRVRQLSKPTLLKITPKIAIMHITTPTPSMILYR